VKIIAHLDMDAFFAAIEERDNPQWAGFPIVVGSDPTAGRGVVSTANYKAREYGIHSALPISRAWRLSETAKNQGQPAAIFLPVNGRHYGQVSEAIIAVATGYAEVIEQASIDEAYLDLSKYRTWKRAEDVCRRLKRAIFKAERLTCSIGLAANKSVAKIASDFHKPDGLTIVRPSGAIAFLAPLDIRRVPGIGPKTEVRLRAQGMNTVGDLQKLTEADWYMLAGEWGLDLYDRVHGGGDTELVTEWIPKSIGEQTTFDEDTLDSAHIVGTLSGICESILRQLGKDGFQSFRRVVLTVRFADFRTVTRSHILAKPTGDAVVLKNEILKLLLPFLDRRENTELKKLRLVGARLEELE
jgi:DNA polymerase IV (DinB-like DNA polymerase)